jgi:hypothetical protein
MDGVVNKLGIIGEDFESAKKVNTIDGILDDDNADALVTGAGAKQLYRRIVSDTGEVQNAKYLKTDSSDQQTVFGSVKFQNGPLCQTPESPTSEYLLKSQKAVNYSSLYQVMNNGMPWPSLYGLEDEIAQENGWLDKKADTDLSNNWLCYVENNSLAEIRIYNSSTNTKYIRVLALCTSCFESSNLKELKENAQLALSDIDENFYPFYYLTVGANQLVIQHIPVRRLTALLFQQMKAKPASVDMAGQADKAFTKGISIAVKRYPINA